MVAAPRIGRSGAGYCSERFPELSQEPCRYHYGERHVVHEADSYSDGRFLCLQVLHQRGHGFGQGLCGLCRGHLAGAVGRGQLLRSPAGGSLSWLAPGLAGLLTTRGPNESGNAELDLDYIEMVVDYVRTGCTRDSEVITPCYSGDEGDPRGACEAGKCVPMSICCTDAGDMAPCDLGQDEFADYTCLDGECLPPQG